MSLKHFEKNDIFDYRLVTYPSYSFKIYKDKIYLNNSIEDTINLNDLNLTSSNEYYGYVVKNSNRDTFKSKSKESYSSTIFGEEIILGYSITSSIDVSYLPADASYSFDRAKIYSLRNALERNKIYSDHYSYNSSYGNKNSMALSIISIPTIFFGSSIKKGSVELNFNYSGTLAATLKDVNKNGELIETVGNKSGSVAGVVLYNEGFVILSGSWQLNTTSTSNWMNWGSGISNNGNSHLYNSASYELKFDGVNYIPTKIMLAHAERNNFNYSNNPTYLKYDKNNNIVNNTVTSSVSFYENEKIEIKNTLKFDYKNYTGSFNKQTFITKIGIFDENKRLIAVAKLSTPIKKTQERDYTFKLKLDI